MTIGTIFRHGIISAAIITGFMMPSTENVNANTNIMDTTSYQAFPLPASKPAICMIKEVGDETNITQKQAAAAALGLYFGLKQATAPQTENKENKQNLCA